MVWNNIWILALTTLLQALSPHGHREKLTQSLAKTRTWYKIQSRVSGSPILYNPLPLHLQSRYCVFPMKVKTVKLCHKHERNP